LSTKTHTPGITQRFLQLCEEVIHEGHASSMTEFAKSIGEHSQNISLMQSGGRVPSVDKLAEACIKYGYSANWLILNRGERKLSKTDIKPIDQRVQQLETTVSSLQRKIKALGK